MDLINSDNPNTKYGGILVGTIIGGVWITSAIYLGIYSYNNPDPATCWVVRDLDSAFLTKEEVVARAVNVDIDITEGYPMEMHKVYTAWFMWGFWSKIIFAISMMVTFGVSFANAYIAKMLAAVEVGLYATNGLLWLILGSVWRFSQPGGVASGDKLARKKGVSDEDWNAAINLTKKTNGYQIQSGRFIKIYVSICFWMILLAVIVLAVAGLTMVFCDPRNKKEGEAEDGDDEANKTDKRSTSTGAAKRRENRA